MASFDPVQRLLVVDDDDSLLAVLALALKKVGFEVVACASGQSALAEAALRPHDFAAVLTDYNMPGMNGVVLIEALRRLDPRLPAVILTGGTGLPREVGVGVAILSKPCSAPRLVDALETVMRAPLKARP